MLARLSGALLIAAFATSSAHAYLGLSIEQAKYRNACEGAAAGITCDSSDTAFRLFGGWDIRPNIAIELGANFLGTVGASTGESADLTAFDVSALGSWPIGNRFAVQGRLGAYFGDMSTPAVSSPDNIAPVALPPPPFPPPPPPRVGWAGGNNTGMTYGLGVRYDMTEKATLRLEWQRFREFGSGGPRFDVDVFSLGALMRF